MRSRVESEPGESKEKFVRPSLAACICAKAGAGAGAAALYVDGGRPNNGKPITEQRRTAAIKSRSQWHILARAGSARKSSAPPAAGLGGGGGRGWAEDSLRPILPGRSH